MRDELVGLHGSDTALLRLAEEFQRESGWTYVAPASVLSPAGDPSVRAPPVPDERSTKAPQHGRMPSRYPRGGAYPNKRAFNDEIARVTRSGGTLIFHDIFRARAVPFTSPSRGPTMPQSASSHFPMRSAGFSRTPDSPFKTGSM